MGRLTKGHLIEAAVWLVIIGVFYAYSFEFNQEIEIYRFGATAWPRVVIVLLLIALIGNLYYQYHHGSAAQGTQLGQVDNDEGDGFRDMATTLRMMMVLFTPFAFAWLLRPVGIYFSAPFFIAAVMLMFGERRIKSILMMTGIIYVIFIGLFLVILNAPLPQGNVSPFYDFSAWMLTMNTRIQGFW